MKIENGCMKPESNEYDGTFNEFQNEIKYPEYIERAILQTVYKQKNLTDADFDNLDFEQIFEGLPEPFVKSIINTIDNMYMEDEKINYSEKHLAYLMYYLPSNTHKIGRILGDLIIWGHLKTTLKVLDLGCGPGSIAVGLIDYFSRIAIECNSQTFKLIITSVDSEQGFIDIAKSIIDNLTTKLPDNLIIEAHYFKYELDNDIEFNGDFSYDLITLSNFLTANEMESTFDKVKFVEKLSKILKDDGSLIIIEPGDENNCQEFKSFRNQIINGNILRMYSPCTPLWNYRTEYNCNCFSSGKVNWKKPKIISSLNERGLRKQKNDIAYNYVIFRKDNYIKYALLQNQETFVPHKNLNEFFGKRVNVAGIVRCSDSNSNSYSISICDGTIGVTKEISVWLYLQNKDTQAYSQFISKLKTMNLGQKIVAKDVICKKGIVHKNSIYLYLDIKSDVIASY